MLFSDKPCSCHWYPFTSWPLCLGLQLSLQMEKTLVPNPYKLGHKPYAYDYSWCILRCFLRGILDIEVNQKGCNPTNQWMSTQLAKEVRTSSVPFVVGTSLVIKPPKVGISPLYTTFLTIYSLSSTELHVYNSYCTLRARFTQASLPLGPPVYGTCADWESRGIWFSVLSQAAMVIPRIIRDGPSWGKPPIKWLMIKVLGTP